jgi:hypothetical protein
VIARFTGGPKSEFVSGRLRGSWRQRIGADVDDRDGVLPRRAEDIRAGIADADLFIVADNDQFALAGRRIHCGAAGERNQARGNDTSLQRLYQGSHVSSYG